MDYTNVEAARTRDGMRLVLSAGVPGPWGEAAKGLFKVRKVDYLAVAQEVGGENADLVDWTGHRNAPIAVYAGERPRVGWAEILLLAERLGSGPSLLPKDASERALMMGWSHELCAESGLGWTRRLMLVDQPIRAGADHPAYAFSRFFGDIYGWSPEAGAAAEARCVAILEGLSKQLAAQHAAGRRYLVGSSLSALDVYWAAFAALIDPLPDDVCPMSPDFRAMYASSPASVKGAASVELLEHRLFVYESALGLPLDF